MQARNILKALLSALDLAAQTPPCAAANDANTSINTTVITSWAIAGPGCFAYQYTPTLPLVAMAMTIVTNQFFVSSAPGCMSLEVRPDNAGMPGARMVGGTWKADLGLRTPYWQGANFDSPVVMQNTQ